MVCLLGSGNVATWMADRLRGRRDFPVTQVYSRQMAHARALADTLGADAVDNPKQIDSACQIFIFALSDDALPQVLSQIPFKMTLAVHTAGSVPQDVLAPYAEHYGVLYPLQTFSKDADMSQLIVPLCVEDAFAGAQRDVLHGLAHTLSDTVRVMDSRQRFYAHVASVFACNFSNALYTVADEILQQHDMRMELLMPLLKQTVAKLDEMPPREAQTGPAKRRDTSVMRRHVEALNQPQWEEIYRVMSDLIISQQRENI